MSAINYPETLARLRAECDECATGTSRPEHVGQLSWHEWGHRMDGAPTESRCTCGVELRNGVRFWHCAGCHETFAGEKPFIRHRRGSGGARECRDLRDGGPSRHWSDAQGVWHYGPRRDFPDAPSASPRSVELAAA